MEFDKSFEGKSWPETKERIGVMSVDSLNRQWELVAEGCGYIIAKSRDGEAALLGRRCKRDDGKFCIEVVVRAEIETNELRHYEFWHVETADGPRYARRLNEAMQGCINRFQRNDDR
ncbi:hypothetical protein [Burkholderia pseudomallei]|uniref:hypothetical protein n=1 Tax=Burkholderia pseudomallei TaxID=28450 RepID=UPI000A1A1C01|nr:hypothetical protein [Burkholderia pseudomallei]ARL97395.1 hypothetical protein BOC58_32470 [Burkholderia pseudomallei]